MSVFTSMSPITDDLFLCGIRGLTPENVKLHGITHIVNVTNDVPFNENQFPKVEFVRYSAVDEPSCDLKKHFNPAADKINEIIRSGGKAVVHCMAGVSRSTSVVLAYLIKYKNMTLREAFKFTREKRAIVHPNNGFFRQLIDFEREIRISEPTVKMVPMNDHSSETIPDIYMEECKGFLWISSIKNIKEDMKKES